MSGARERELEAGVSGSGEVEDRARWWAEGGGREVVPAVRLLRRRRARAREIERETWWTGPGPWSLSD